MSGGGARESLLAGGEAPTYKPVSPKVALDARAYFLLAYALLGTGIMFGAQVLYAIFVDEEYFDDLGGEKTQKLMPTLFTLAYICFGFLAGQFHAIFFKLVGVHRYGFICLTAHWIVCGIISLVLWIPMPGWARMVFLLPTMAFWGAFSSGGFIYILANQGDYSPDLKTFFTVKMLAANDISALIPLGFVGVLAVWSYATLPLMFLFLGIVGFALWLAAWRLVPAEPNISRQKAWENLCWEKLKGGYQEAVSDFSTLCSDRPCLNKLHFMNAIDAGLVSYYVATIPQRMERITGDSNAELLTNASVAILSIGAVLASNFFVAPLLDKLTVRVSLIVGLVTKTIWVVLICFAEVFPWWMQFASLGVFSFGRLFLFQIGYHYHGVCFKGEQEGLASGTMLTRGGVVILLMMAVTPVIVAYNLYLIVDIALFLIIAAMNLWLVALKPSVPADGSSVQ